MHNNLKEKPQYKPQDKGKDQQLAALLAALSIVGFVLVYWVMQIQSVRELLAIAYA